MTAWGDRYLLVLGAAMSLRERAIVAAVRTFDGPIVTVARNRNSKLAKFFDDILIGDFSDPDEVLRLVLEHEKETGRTPAGVVPFFDPGLVPGWTVADHYGLPFLSRTAVDDSSINKDRMKDRLLAAGVPTPRYIRVANVAEAVTAGENFGFPCVIKPCAFGGSLGVRLVSDVDEMAEAYSYVRGIIDTNAAVFTVKNREIQVEEYCTLTDEVSVEVLNHRDQRVVLGVTDKIVGPRPYFAELGHRVPSVYTDREDVHDIAIRACAAIGLDRGVAHVELRLEPDAAPQIIEVGARTAGDGIIDQVERAYGVSPYALHVRSFLDRIDTPVVVPRPLGLAGISMLKAPAGRIASVNPVSEVDPTVVAYEVTAAPGAESAAISANYLNREGYVEFSWPGARPEDVPLATQTDIANSLSTQLFRMT
jgi:formate-dependent phosphoribosylglycinamide formyltransferase (GAR transformylase)